MGREPSDRERFEVLLEQVRRELEIVAEGYVSLDRKIDGVASSLKGEIGGLRTEMRLGFSQLRGEMAAVRFDLGNLTTRVESHERTHGAN
jgi:hypothetical protein